MALVVFTAAVYNKRHPAAAISPLSFALDVPAATGAQMICRGGRNDGCQKYLAPSPGYFACTMRWPWRTNMTFLNSRKGNWRDGIF